MIKLISYLITSGGIWILIFLFITILVSLIKNKFKINVRLIFAHEIELFILLILFTIIIIITAIRHPVLNNFITKSSSDEKIAFIQFIIEAELLVIALLILTRITYTRISFMIASYILLSGWLVSRFIFDTIPSLKFVNETTVHGLFERGLFVSTYIATTFRQLIVYFVSFILGLYCVRKSFQYWKFCVGFIAGNFITYLLFLNEKSFSLLEFIFFLVVIILPLQKKALERLCGFPLKPRQSPELPLKTSFLSSAFQHFTMLLILFFVCFFTIFGYYERNLFRVIKNGPKPIHYSPAAHNAYNDFKELFTKKVSKKIDESTYSFFPKYDLIINSTSPELIKRTFNIIDKNELEKSLSKLLPYIKTFEEARNADYCLYYESKYRAVPDFYNFRETTRFLGIRAMLRMYENRNEEALYDIETILNTAWLLNNNGSLVFHMVGGALRGIGLKVAHNYYLKFRRNPEAMNLLDEMLKRVEHKVRISFPVENLKRYEPALWELVPYFELIVPGFTKAYVTFYGKWVQYDQLVLSVALEKYRNEYKAYPDKLEELVPKFLEQLPLDPFKAKSYIYKNFSSEFSVSCEYLNSEPYEWMKTGEFYYKGLVFPPSKVENEDLRKEIEKLERDKN